MLTIMLNYDRTNEFHIRIAHPFYQANALPLPFAMHSKKYKKLHYANMTTANPSEPMDLDEDNVDDNNKSSRLTTRVSMELLHHRLGHLSTQAIINADKQQMWNDITVLSDYDQFCTGCKIGSIHKSARTQQPVDTVSTRPAQVIFMDIIPHPFRVSLTPKSYHPYFLIIACSYSR
jgi:hypothetical protein